MSFQNKKYSAFTLIELIVVITILAILGTISFVSFNDYTKSARDSKRTSDVNSISKSIEVGIVTNGVVPTPVGGVSYTGGTSGTGTSLVNLVVGTVNKSILPNISGELKDPSSKNEYKYSTIQGKTYYQIGVEYEKDISYLDNFKLLTSTYGNKFSITKSALAATTNNTVTKLNGNYVFDPSLPSLFPIASTVSSASGGIFSPDVCFVLNNVSSNSFSSTSTNCTKKKDLSLNTFDSSLVGYWDMETLTIDGKLKDLSGNGNDGEFSGTILPSSTGGYLGKGIKLISSNGGNAILIKVPQINTNLYHFSYQLIGKTTELLKYSSFIGKNPYSYTGTKLIRDMPLKLHNASNGKIGTYISEGELGLGTNWFGIEIYGRKDIEVEKYYIYTMTFNNGEIKFYINGQIQSYGVSTGTGKYIAGIESYLMLGRGSNIGGTPIYTNCVSGGIGGGNNCFDGTIDDVKIYNRALSDEEIKQQAQSAGF